MSVRAAEGTRRLFLCARANIHSAGFRPTTTALRKGRSAKIVRVQVTQHNLGELLRRYERIVTNATQVRKSDCANGREARPTHNRAVSFAKILGLLRSLSYLRKRYIVRTICLEKKASFEAFPRVI